LTNHAALRCQGMGRGGGVAAGHTVKTSFIHTSVRRPAQRTPRPQNLHSDPNLQIRQPCGVRGRGGAGGGAAGRTPERKFGKLRLRACPEPHSQRPGLKLDRQAEKTRLSRHTSFGDQGCSEKCCGKNWLFGSWRKLPGAQPSPCPPNIIWPHRRWQETFLSVPDGSGDKERRDEKFAAPCKHTTGCTNFHNSSCKGL